MPQLRQRLYCNIHFKKCHAKVRKIHDVLINYIASFTHASVLRAHPCERRLACDCLRTFYKVSDKFASTSVCAHTDINPVCGIVLRQAISDTRGYAFCVERRVYICVCVRVMLYNAPFPKRFSARYDGLLLPAQDTHVTVHVRTPRTHTRN